MLIRFGLLFRSPAAYWEQTDFAGRTRWKIRDVNRNQTVATAFYSLQMRGRLLQKKVDQAIKTLNINPEKPDPIYV